MAYKKEDLLKFLQKAQKDSKINANEFVEYLKVASFAYYNKTSPLSDQQFDFLKELFESQNPNHPYLEEVGASPNLNPLFEKEQHTIPMTSLQKTPSFDELKAWAEKNGKDQDLISSEKIDGLSVNLIYNKGKLVKALSRGDGTVGENITQNVLKMNVPKTIPIKTLLNVRGEIVLKRSLFQKHFEGMANPRNAAVGAVKRLNGEGCEFLTVLVYNILGDEISFETHEEKLIYLKEKLKLDTPLWKKVKIDGVLNMWEDYESSLRASSDFEMDGLVIEFNDLKLQSTLGFVSKRPKFAKALKFTADDGHTKLNDCIWQVGRTGRITPVGLVEPLLLAGATINKVSLHNLREIERLGIKIGQTVVLRRSGDVIPQVTGVVDQVGTPIKIPDHCPSCGKKTEKEVFLWCVNKKCPEQVYQNLLFWVETLEVKGFGEALVRQLFDIKKLKTIADFYKLTVKDISELEKRGEKTATKVLKELNSKRELSLPIFIKALGIDGVGKTATEIIQFKYPTLKDMRKISESYELTKLDGIGEITANAFIQGLKDHSEVLDELLNYITIKYEVTEGSLSGKSFCFTGFRDAELTKKIEEQGGKIASGVSKNLTYLVAEDKDSESDKIKKAKSYGVIVLDRDDLVALVDQ